MSGLAYSRFKQFKADLARISSGLDNSRTVRQLLVPSFAPVYLGKAKAMYVCMYALFPLKLLV